MGIISISFQEGCFAIGFLILCIGIAMAAPVFLKLLLNILKSLLTERDQAFKKKSSKNISPVYNRRK